MVTRVPPDTGPYDGHAMSTETSLNDTTNNTHKQQYRPPRLHRRYMSPCLQPAFKRLGKFLQNLYHYVLTRLRTNRSGCRCAALWYMSSVAHGVSRVFRDVLDYADIVQLLINSQVA